MTEADKAIQSVLNNPGTSYWLRDALLACMKRDCVDAVNDAEHLFELLEARALAAMEVFAARQAQP